MVQEYIAPRRASPDAKGDILRANRANLEVIRLFIVITRNLGPFRMPDHAVCHTFEELYVVCRQPMVFLTVSFRHCLPPLFVTTPITYSNRTGFHKIPREATAEKTG